VELLGYDHTVHNVVHAHQLPATVTTFWRPLRPLPAGQAFALYFGRDDGAIVYHYAGPTATTLWYPTERWTEGELIRVETPTLSVGRLRDVVVGVVEPGGDPLLPEGRLAVVAPPGDSQAKVSDGGTLLALFSFR
jgi:hypothetical protein